MKRQLAKREKTTKPEKPETTELADLEFVRSEVNLLVFPFFALTTKGLRRRLETEFRAVAERDGQRIEILWNVSANPKYGSQACLTDRSTGRLSISSLRCSETTDRWRTRYPWGPFIVSVR